MVTEVALAGQLPNTALGLVFNTKLVHCLRYFVRESSAWASNEVLTQVVMFVDYFNSFYEKVIAFYALDFEK